jgi:uncharacterized protein YndB with AHSA1/START domain
MIHPLGIVNNDSAQPLLITRTFDAPLPLVWRALTEADLLNQWWAPKGFTIEVITCNLQPGGIFHYRLTAANGYVMWGKFVYQEISAPERLVFTNAFADADGNTIKNPFLQKLALESLITITLQETDGKTTLTLNSAPINASTSEWTAFTSIISTVHQGFVGTFDQLDALLRSQQSS